MWKSHLRVGSGVLATGHFHWLLFCFPRGSTIRRQPFASKERFSHIGHGLKPQTAGVLMESEVALVQAQGFGNYEPPPEESAVWV